MSQTSKPPKLCFEADDAFGWSGFAGKLEDFLRTETDFVEGSLVATLNAPFGRGKTTFIQMWKNHLDSRRESESDVPVCVVLNAWEDDYCGDPLLSLVSAIEKELAIRKSDKTAAVQIEAVKEATRDIGWFMLAMANSAVSHFTGMDPIAAGEVADRKKANRSKVAQRPDMLRLFQFRKDALQRLKLALQSLFESEKRPVFVLVDELDRCRPDFAIHYLETIKHVFDVKGLAFFLAVDLQQLESSARAMFGNGLDFPEYYRKFSHRTIRLPEINLEGIRRLASNYTNCFLDDPATEAPRRKTFLNLHDTRRALTELPLDFRLTPRQIQETFRILGHMTSVREKKGDLYYHIASATIFLICLQLFRPEIFEEIREGKVNHNRLLEIISQLPLSRDRDWWAFVLTLCLVSDDDKLQKDHLLKAFVKFGFVEKEMTDEQFQKRLAGYIPGGYGGWSSLSDLARRIQEIERFAQ